jgi:hypothetical protein
VAIAAIVDRWAGWILLEVEGVANSLAAFVMRLCGSGDPRGDGFRFPRPVEEEEVVKVPETVSVSVDDRGNW